MAKIERFEDLTIWKKGVDIAVQVYELADKGTLAADYRSRSQLVAAALSISNNIAEGFEYNNNKVFVKFLHYSKGSAGEVRSQLAVLVKAGRVQNEDYLKLKSELIILSSQIKAFINYLVTLINNSKKK